VYAAVYAGEAVFEFLVNGEVKYRQIMAQLYHTGHLNDQCFEIRYRLNPSDTASVRYRTISEIPRKRYDVASAIQAITLSEYVEEGKLE
jgi:hypothetical protein